MEQVLHPLTLRIKQWQKQLDWIVTLPYWRFQRSYGPTHLQQKGKIYVINIHSVPCSTQKTISALPGRDSDYCLWAGQPGGRIQWPSGPRQRSAEDHLVGLRVRIPPEAWMFVLCNNKDKSQMQDSQDKERSTEYTRIQKKKSRWEQNLSQPSRPGLGPTQLPIHGYRLSSPGVKHPKCGIKHPSHLAPRLKKE